MAAPLSRLSPFPYLPKHFHLSSGLKMSCGIFRHFLKFLVRSGAFACAGCSIMGTGHFILQHAHVSGYAETSIQSSIKLGAIGGCLMTIPMLIFEWMIMKIQEFPIEGLDPEHDAESSEAGSENKAKRNWGNISISLLVLQFVIGICGIVALGAGSGAIGAAIFTKATHHKAIGILLATRAGAVGSTILGPGAIVLVLLLVGCCGGMIGAILLLAKRASRKEEPDEEVAATEK